MGSVTNSRLDLPGLANYVIRISNLATLGPVREVLVQKDDDWEEWGLEELVENLRS